VAGAYYCVDMVSGLMWHIDTTTEVPTDIVAAAAAKKTPS